MKKSLLLFPVLASLLCGCTLDDLMFWNTKEAEQNQNDEKSSGNTGENESGDHFLPDQTISVKGIVLNKSTLELAETQSAQLTYTITPSNATNQNVRWETSNGTVASVENGLVKAWNGGFATITATTEDGNYKATCSVTVTTPSIHVETTTASFNFSEQGYTSDSVEVTDPIAITDKISVSFDKAEGNTTPKIWKNGNKNYDIRVYPGNTFTFTSVGPKMHSIEFTLGSGSGLNELTPNNGTFDSDVWTGNTTSVTFTVGGTSGHRRINIITVEYEGKEPGPEDVVNLGVMSIKEVRDYIAANPVKKNSAGIGVNEYRYVTIRGFALAKIDLIKTTSAFGLNVSKPGKVILADSTGYIAAATDVTGDGTTLWGEVGDHVCKETSIYMVTGYISEYLGHPEILVETFEWGSNLPVTWNSEVISDAKVDIEGFYQKAKDINYNCAGHGYGEVVTMERLQLYYIESDGSGKRYYNFTDGTRNIRINAYNLDSLTFENKYDVTGIISLKNLSPIIIAFEIKKSYDESINIIHYEDIATNISIAGLKQIHGSQEDTATRYPEVIEAYKNLYKTTGYLTLVVEAGKYYVGISDSYIARKDLIEGKNNAMANYGISLIKNDDFWNTTEEDLYYYNPLFDDYVLEDNPITVYYTLRQLSYQSNKPMWEILLLPDFLNDLKPDA